MYVFHSFLSPSFFLQLGADTRLRQILNDHLAAPDSPAPPAAEVAETTVVSEEIGGIPAGVSLTSSFHFMQDSELETPTFEQDAQWVEKPEDDLPTPESTDALGGGVAAGLGQDRVEVVPPADSGPIDWANDDGGLPEISSLEAKFGPSGEATPQHPADAPAADGWAAADAAPAPALVSEAGRSANAPSGNRYTPPPPNGPIVDEDGFISHQRQRTVSQRGYGGDRGRGRGFRGGDRGTSSYEAQILG